MSDQKFDWSILTPEDLNLAASIIDGGGDRIIDPDLVIAPSGKDIPYLYRWHIIRLSKEANVYFHVQVASDPERPLHDHPWDNFSVILSGGYDELWDPAPGIEGHAVIRKFRKGDTVKRKASEAHRLLLPKGIPYAMTMFSTGPKINDWGFWYPEGKRLYQDVTRVEGNVSYHVRPEAKDAIG